ncbi:uncharacterized protein N7484_001980 [Penicillium longicatenatum]|uniref:uncharacterized protein n=1 Tax=Penicillium longicatenatum TaxID=1561947 RepID=UPI0025481DC3|nr:uncharacterized protein N7484_001980 [Penicillium longicatenatum]KAJ5658331.1 hypothetical protein N7484_001980 [Penicillium longicatenatum]
MSFLPPEIWFYVLDELEQTSDRIRLLQVCRHWNTALFAKVYSSLMIPFPEKLVAFAEALHQNPRLKPLVHELHIPDFYAEQFEDVRVYNRTLFHKFLESFADNDEELTKWEENLDIQNTSAWLTVILISLPNLQHLHLRWGGYGSETANTRWAISKIASKSPREDLPLQHLQTLTSVYEDVKECFPAEEFIPFLKLSSMRTLHLSTIIDRVSDDEDPIFGVSFDLPQGVSRVRKLILKNSNTPHGLPEFIAACARLEHFEYQHNNQFEWGEAYRNYRCRVFRAPLLTQKDSLRVLRLNDVGVTKPQEVDEPEKDLQASKAQAWFGSLVEFVALKELRIPVRNLLDGTASKEPSLALSEVLPSGLEILVLTKVDFVECFMLERQLKRFLDVKEQQFPQLRILSLQTFQMEVFPGEKLNLETNNWAVPRLVETVFADVRSICEGRGVEFSFAHDGDFQILADGEVVDDTDEYGGRTAW